MTAPDHIGDAAATPVAAFIVGSNGTNVTLTPSPQNGITGMENLLQRLQPGVPVLAARSRPITARRDWSTLVCLSCGKSGHREGRCRELNETFPYMLPGSMEKVGANYMAISPRMAAERLRAENDN